VNYFDAHHHLWDLNAVSYPWLEAKGVTRFFGDPAPIQRNYLIDEFKDEAAPFGFSGSVHIQVGAADAWEEAQWVQDVADANLDWPMAQVVYCDLTRPDLEEKLDQFQRLSTVKGVRQIVGRAPGEDAQTGTNELTKSDVFLEGLKALSARGLSFDLQLIPELMPAMVELLQDAPNTPVALCHAGSPHDRSPLGLAEYSKTLRHLSRLPQVYCKLSGLGMFDHTWDATTIRPIVDSCLDQFGVERCMFGSNFPVDKLYSDYAKLAQSYFEIVPTVYHNSVFSEVAQAFYGFGRGDRK
jgi:predicted TIM-barrel fold metal-dependent hydrolase